MRRREFISVIAGATVWPLTARAEQPTMPVIGFLGPNLPTAEAVQPLLAAFRRGLAEAGYVEGKNLATEYRFTNFKPELMPEAARDLVRLNVNVIFAVTPEAVVAVRGTRIMTRQPPDSDTHPFGHSVRKGSTLHPHRTKRTHSDDEPPRSHHRIHGPAHDVDVAVAKARRGHGRSHKNKRKR